MPNFSKKQKLHHGLTASRAPGNTPGAAAAPHVKDARFQVNLDFPSSEGFECDLQDAFTIAASQGQRQPNVTSTPSGKAKARQLASQGAQYKASNPFQSDSPSAYPGDDGVEDQSGDATVSNSQSGEGDAADGAAISHQSAQDAPTLNKCNNDGSGGNGNEQGGSGRGDGDPEGKCKRKKVLSKKKLQQVNEASDRRGIVYISRIPPHMKPHKLRHLLGPFGDIGRVYCAQEDPALRRLRKQKGGNSGKNFTEGWVEFEDKRRAKRAALALNGQPMGGSKRSAYHYDLWAIKYLPKFKWDALTEEINYQRAVREQRLVTEISAAKRERDFYLSRVDKAKANIAIQGRRNAKQLLAGAEGGPGNQESAAPSSATASAGTSVVDTSVEVAAPRAGGGGSSGPGFARHFGQRRAKADPVLDEGAPVLADDVLGLLGRKRKAQQ